MKYTYKDVIIDPEDPRVEIGAKYYFSDSPINIVTYANEDNKNWLGTLASVKASGDYRFTVQGEVYTCLIHRKEPEKKYVPFDLSKEEDKTKLRGAWIRPKDDGLWHEAQIVEIDKHAVGITNPDREVSPDDLLEFWEFLDGSSCGKLVEEE